jgi:hypothetical protein
MCIRGFITCPAANLTCDEYASCQHDCLGLPDCLAACDTGITPHQCDGSSTRIDMTVPDLGGPDLSELDLANSSDDGDARD